MLSALSLSEGGDKSVECRRDHKETERVRERESGLSLSLYLSLWSLRHSTLLSRPSEKERERSLSTPLALTSFNSQPRVRFFYPTVLFYANCNLLSRLLFISSVDNCSEANCLARNTAVCVKQYCWVRIKRILG